MPYTKKDNRMLNSTEIKDVCLYQKGDLTAAIFDLQLRYILEKGVSYQSISDTVSAAHDAGVEIERRILSYYEDRCIVKNGDFSQVDKIIDKIVEKFDETEETLKKASEIFDYGGSTTDSTLDEETVEKECAEGRVKYKSIRQPNCLECMHVRSSLDKCSSCDEYYSEFKTR